MVYALAARPEQKLLLMIYGSLLLTHASTVFLGWLQARHHIESTAWAQFFGFLASAVAITAGLVIHAPLWFFATTYVLERWLVMIIAMLMFRRSGGRFTGWQWSQVRTVGLLKESWFELASLLALMLLLR